MKEGIHLALGGVLLAGAALAQDLPSGDPIRGAKLIGKCRTCHGADGIAELINAPNIAGDPENYIATQLAHFRDGLRLSEQMSVVVQGMADQDIADLAAHYASIPFTATPPSDESAAPELCVSCHGTDGMATIEDAPHIAGDSAIYIETQLKAFRDGKRQNEIMSGIAAGLSAEEIRASAVYYSSIEVSAGE